MAHGISVVFRHIGAGPGITESIAGRLNVTGNEPAIYKSESSTAWINAEENCPPPKITDPLLFSKFDLPGGKRSLWRCLAGKFSFGVKPDRDFWICQNHPSHPLLNILDPDFMENYRQADFANRAERSGCPYSCYFVTQKLLSRAAEPVKIQIPTA
jgi:hypothetical protein